MFRENVLVNDQIIDRISSTMIPIALDIQEVLNPRSKGARFLLPLVKPGKRQRLSNETDQGVWVFSPEGKLLGGPFAGFGNMVRRTNKFLDNALKGLGPIKRRKTKVVDRHPYRGKGVISDGSVCLAEYVRASDKTPHLHGMKAPVISSVTLTRKEIGAFAPRKAVHGAKWKLPDAVAKKLRRVMSVYSVQYAPGPESVTDVLLNAEVRRIENGVAWLSYYGRISSWDPRGGLKNGSEVKLTGEGVYDIRTRKMRSVLIVGSGIARTSEFPGQTFTFNSLIEWVVEHPETSSKKRRRGK